MACFFVYIFLRVKSSTKICYFKYAMVTTQEKRAFTIQTRKNYKNKNKLLLSRVKTNKTFNFLYRFII